MAETGEQSWTETITAEGGQLLEEVKRLIHEGNVRRVVIKQEGNTVVEFPLTIGVVGVALAPVLAAIGALAALLTECSIEVERSEEPAATMEKPVEKPIMYGDPPRSMPVGR